MSTGSGHEAARQPRGAGAGRGLMGGRTWRRLLAAVGALMLLAATGMPFSASARALSRGALARNDTPTMTIVNPKSQSGPVGTNVYATIQGAAANEMFTLGYARAMATCELGFTPFDNVSPTSADSDGNVSIQFVWPATDTGNFLVCAQDSATPGNLVMVHSSHVFRVLSTTPPQITVTPASPPPGSGTPTGATGATAAAPGSTYYTGQTVVITGTGFLPANSSIDLYISGTETSLGAKLATSHDVVSDGEGGFMAQVVLPAYRIGSLYLQAATKDGGNGVPPSLFADAPVTIAQSAPTPTPSPSPTPSPTKTVVVSNGSGGGGADTGGSTGHLLGAIGLGSLSVLLLLTGIILLVSAGGTEPQR